MWVWKELPPADWGCFDYDVANATFTERPTMKKVLARVRPSAVAGWPSAVSFDRASGAFSMTFTADPTVKAPHLVAVAPTLGKPLSVTCDGAALTPVSTDAYGTMSLLCGQGDGASHTLAVSVAPLP
jgi:Glycoside hydrolase family 5 C-terminal domain